MLQTIIENMLRYAPVALLLNGRALTNPQEAPCPPDGPGCSAPFPPGAKSIGESNWGIGNEHFGYYIESVTTLLTVPEAPPASAGTMVINPALENPQALQTYQILTVAFPENACNQTTGQWCMFASYYEDDPVQQPSGRLFPVGPGDTVNVTYIYHNRSRSLDEFGITERGDTTVFSGIPNVTEPWAWWPRAECLCESRGSIPQHTYSNTTITLNTTTPEFNMLVSSDDVNRPAVYSYDGGRVWHVDDLTIEENWCENNASCNSTQPDLAGV